MRRVYFDLNLIAKQKFGVSYAVLELMKAVKQQNIDVVNLAVGFNGLDIHKDVMLQEGIEVKAIKIPRKINKYLNKLSIPYEQFFLKRFDIYFQVGFHASRQINKRKTVISIHDMLGMRYQENTKPLLSRVQKEKLLQNSRKIVTVSEFSKQEMLEVFELDPKQIAVVPNGCNFNRFNLNKDEQKIQTLRENYNLPDNYYVTYGGSSARKNLSKLFEIFDKQNLPYPLVTFGQSDEKEYKNVIKLGYLPEQDVEYLLKNSFALVFPSYYEGFGLPIIEAQACGVPVVCSRASSLPEVSGGHAVFFDPFDDKDMFSKILNVYEDNKTRETNIKNGLEWVAQFTWERAAEKLIGIF
jgi:glycosyltransferase involved in cell wall biosynthesis